MVNRNQTYKWINSLENNKISMDSGILDKTKNRGIYGIFVIDVALNTEYCAYVGKANNIYERFLSGREAHFVKLKNGILNNSKITEALNNPKKRIEVRVLEYIEFKYKNYAKDTQFIASREYHYIDYYQSLDQCLEQLPDGSNIKLSAWEKEKSDKNKVKF